MSFLKYDLFSSKFYMNVGGQQIRKGTVFGMLLSILIIGLASAYFIYILYQYFTNGIEPNYREQSFITQQKIDIELNNNLVGFRFEYDVNKSIQQLEAQQNKTYLVFIALFFYYDNDFYQNIPLDIIQCTDENLIGYYCLDYSKIANYTLTLSTIDNIQSQIQVFSYGCLDLDQLKTTIPDNCATQPEIDSIVNGVNAGQRMKFYTSQYNVTSQQIQINYRNSFVYTLATQYILSTFRTQKQITSIKEGFFVQSQTRFTSPIQYELQNQVLDRQYALTQVGEGPFIQISVEMDEIVQQIQVQYSTLPQVLAQVNSTIAALMLLGIIGKQFSQSSLRNDFLMILLKNVFQEKYFEILRNNNFLEIKDLDNRNKIYQKHLSQMQIEENLERQEKDDNQFISIPTNNYKFKQEVQVNNQSEMSNILKLQELNQDEIKQVDTTFTQKKQDFPEIDLSQRYNFSDKKSQTEQFNIQSYENAKIQNENVHQYQDQIQSTNRYFTEKSKLQNITFMTMLSNVPIIKKSNFTGDYSPNRFKCKNLEQKNDTNKHYSMKFVALKDKKISDKIKTIVFGAKLCNKENFLKSQGLNKQSFKIIKSQIDKDLDILELYQDIIFLKKAIMILFTTDQLAAIRLIGCSSSFLDSQLLDFETQKDISHYEKQFAISLSDELQYKYVNKFLKRCQESESIDQLDEKILTSMYKQGLS
ncbi:AMP-binding enzyme family protein (macronuclear) [Tetrahymena thermophila SB210]|uniref:AMP-binding enzyme family protein n=1 Tax=Tetrahymena thermophila (strain SB210) TaxID=312017 RepID=Q22T99_TETTS|nr:AMP-binding enzyme family protein [Tetrahymena thermophila SB210]EAR88539.2 AMP-binding enzyme family protein [Tetrahymena thermophila SB210]|eukprot:XP_001008784.2 AMP-binding enzyme family protein [Tetrahymena thermophila SB210]